MDISNRALIYRKLGSKVMLIIIVITAFQGCYSKFSGIWNNDNIDKEKRAQIKVINDKLYHAIINNDVETINGLLGDKLPEKGIERLESLVGTIIQSSAPKGYKVFDEYYMCNMSNGATNNLMSGTSGDNDYTLNCKVVNKEMYVSLLLLDNLKNEILITSIYGKHGNQWKIEYLQAGLYSIGKKTAPDYLKLAKESYDRSNLIDAVNYLVLMNECVKPVKDIFHYQKENEMNNFYQMVMQEANAKYPLPMTLNNIDTKPEIFKISPYMVDDGIFPMIYYTTKLNLKDTIELRREYDKIKMEVGGIFQGIDHQKKYVFYTAFREIPEGNREVEHFRFIDQLLY